MKNLNEISIIQITDTHIVPRGEYWRGDSKAQTDSRLRLVVEHINNLPWKPDLVIRTGDIVDNGSVSSYRYAKEILDNLNVEYFLVCGNHDNFENLQKVFGDHKYFSDSKFSQYYIDFPNLRLVAMDTRVIGKEFGALCKDRLHWLELRLKETVKPIMIFLHHFPVEVDSSLFKDLNLLNSNELSEIISRYDSLLGLYCGHYHHSSVNKFAKKIC